MKVLLLTFLQVLYTGGFSFNLPDQSNIPSDGQSNLPKDFLKGLSNDFPKDLFSGLTNGPKGLFNGLPNDFMNGIPSGLSDGVLDGPNDPLHGLPKGFLDDLPKDLFKKLPNEFSKDTQNGIPNEQKDHTDGRRLNGFPIILPSENAPKQNMSCCYSGTCYNPCPIAPSISMAYPVPVPEPVIVPARTYYEPVVHNHPPLHKIHRMINQGKTKRHKAYESSDVDYSESDTDSDSEDNDSSVNYYDDFLPLRARRRS